jgi:hypothetical protein
MFNTLPFRFNELFTPSTVFVHKKILIFGITNSNRVQGQPSKCIHDKINKKNSKVEAETTDCTVLLLYNILQLRRQGPFGPLPTKRSALVASLGTPAALKNKDQATPTQYNCVITYPVAYT